MNGKQIQMSAYVFCAAILAACGGGGGGAIVSTPASFQNASGTQAVTVLRADRSPMVINVSTEFFGDLIFDTEQIYSGLESTGGVVGIETSIANVATTGIFNYSGVSVVLISDSENNYSVEGTSIAQLTLTDSSSDLDLRLSGFSEGSCTGVVGICAPNDIVITWIGAELTGSRLGGGLINITGTAAPLSENALTGGSGILFGPSGEEIGGMIYVDDPSILLVNASFIAKQ